MTDTTVKEVKKILKNQYGSTICQDLPKRRAEVFVLKNAGIPQNDIAKIFGRNDSQITRDLEHTFQDPSATTKLLETNPEIKVAAEKKRNLYLKKLDARYNQGLNWLKELMDTRTIKGLKDVMWTVAVLSDKIYRIESRVIDFTGTTFEDHSGVKPDQLNVKIREIEFKWKKRMT